MTVGCSGRVRGVGTQGSKPCHRVATTPSKRVLAPSLRIAQRRHDLTVSGSSDSRRPTSALLQPRATCARTSSSRGDRGGPDNDTYRDLRRDSARFAAALADLGIGPGDAVATLMAKSADLVVALLDIWRRGAMHVPLFTAFAPSAVALRLGASGAKAVVVDADQHGRLAPGEDMPADRPWLTVVAGGAPESAELSSVNCSPGTPATSHRAARPRRARTTLRWSCCSPRAPPALPRTFRFRPGAGVVLGRPGHPRALQRGEVPARGRPAQSGARGDGGRRPGSRCRCLGRVAPAGCRRRISAARVPPASEVVRGGHVLGLFTLKDQRQAFHQTVDAVRSQAHRHMLRALVREPVGHVPLGAGTRDDVDGRPVTNQPHRSTARTPLKSAEKGAHFAESTTGATPAFDVLWILAAGAPQRNGFRPPPRASGKSIPAAPTRPGSGRCTRPGSSGV
ncbi:hypothetical protein QFZ76_008237 [Streptomyces sp. V4I2]|nr:hypothetical protein [Streptomyces sp. V4I2]